MPIRPKPEKWVNDRFKELFHALEGPKAIQKLSDRYTSGIPDYIIACGKLAFVECKQWGKRPSKLQHLNMMKFLEAGVPSLWFTADKIFVTHHVTKVQMMKLTKDGTYEEIFKLEELFK